MYLQNCKITPDLFTHTTSHCSDLPRQSSLSSPRMLDCYLGYLQAGSLLSVVVPKNAGVLLKESMPSGSSMKNVLWSKMVFKWRPGPDNFTHDKKVFYF